jgi:hypothetical protein
MSIRLLKFAGMAAAFVLLAYGAFIPGHFVLAQQQATKMRWDIVSLPHGGPPVMP